MSGFVGDFSPREGETDSASPLSASQSHVEILAEEDAMSGPSAHKKPNLTDDQRLAAYHMMLEMQIPEKPGKLKRGALKLVAEKFKVTSDTISAIWKRGQQSIAEGKIVADCSSKIQLKSGRKKLPFNSDALKDIPFHKRQNQRSLALQLNMSKTRVQRLLREQQIKAHSNAIKPLLTDANKQARVEYCLSFLNDQGQYDDMMDLIHIDEKWFYITRTNQRYYLAPDEEPPHRTCKSKRFITKVMFMAAVARPRWDTHGNALFDGKIGIFPFVYQKKAQRSSRNREAGTLETKPIECINKEETRKLLIEKVLPAIREKWPKSWRGKDGRNVIKIQQDNARPHLSSDDEILAAEMKKDGLAIELVNQPPNSPDLNVLDLGWFRSIQSLQHQQDVQRNEDDLLKAVQDAFTMLPSKKLNNIFLTLQQCMTEIMKCDGSNNYKIPHMQKDAIIRRGELPDTLKCDIDVVEKAKSFIQCSQ